MNDWKEVGKLFQRAREDAGLDQDQAAEIVGKSGPGGRVTISRWETGKNRIPLDAAAKLARSYGKSLSELGITAVDRVSDIHDSKYVSRGTQESLLGAPTKPYGLPAKVESMFEAFRREMLRAGADDAEIDYVNAVLHHPDAARLAHQDAGGKPLTPAQTEEQYGYQIEAIRALITRRIEARKKKAK